MKDMKAYGGEVYTYVLPISFLTSAVDKLSVQLYTLAALPHQKIPVLIA